ncbi:hypothetical protein R5R35_000610 [Gryllus longicercus]|uniref:Uncharacterized protein n=1 Tax=Gryllus longicercus TaxID=2509291 RepID=A0AAN9VN69_9ORTH
MMNRIATISALVALLLCLLQSPCEAEQLAAPRAAGLLDEEQLATLGARGRLAADDAETPTSFSGLLAAVGLKMAGRERNRRAPGAADMMGMMGGASKQAKDVLEKAKGQMKQMMENAKGMGGKQSKETMQKATKLMQGAMDKATKLMGGKGGKQMAEAMNQATKQMKNMGEKMTKFGG